MSVKAIVKGTVVSMLITFVFIFLMSVVLYFSMLDEKIVSTGVYIGTAIGVIIGAVSTAKSAQRRVLINCLVMGIVYFMILCGLTVIVNGAVSFGYNFITVAAGVIICSVFGAVVGK